MRNSIENSSDSMRLKKIDGVIKFGKAQAIAVNAIKPTDNRVTTSKYVNWRKQSKDKVADDYKIPR